MKYRKFSKQEKQELRRSAMKKAMAGSGLFLYENSSKTADLNLPRPTITGIRSVGPGKQFQGDDYFLQMVRTGELKLIQVLEKEPNMNEETNNMEEKLILDQPDIVTEKGKLEQVVEKPTTPLHETDKQTEQDVLLNEQPVENDGFVILT